MSFLNILKDIGKGAEVLGPTVLTTINPAVGAISEALISGITKAEQSGATGEAKKTQVVTAVLPVVAQAIQTAMPTASGVDSQGATAAVGQLVDGMVALLNSVKQQTPATTDAATPAAATPEATPAAATTTAAAAAPVAGS